MRQSLPSPEKTKWYRSQKGAQRQTVSWESLSINPSAVCLIHLVFSSVWFVLLQSYKTNKYVCGIFGPVCFAYCVSIQERFIEFENLHSKVIVKRRPDELCILNVELAPRKVQNGVSIQSTVHTMSGVKRPLNLKSLWTAF